ncbi:Ig-like domain-containing protein [Geobacter pelophilus]|uniref:Ig-like domain-containing protein n=1 Tax=Geoanaerobacter pelophilus TaxID=60036 RepID=A0AAW4L3Q9_9BACT|nr:Ig-like domain-containing protein [Geoanaerobacter pelophilus]MBT0665626.1 Ig-like domain-containing protein [Geoanaerobacter pelophilus]
MKRLIIVLFSVLTLSLLLSSLSNAATNTVTTTPADDPSFLNPVAVDVNIYFTFGVTVPWDEIYHNNQLRITLRKKGTTANLLTSSDFTRWSTWSGSWVDPDSGSKKSNWYKANPSTDLLPNTVYEIVINKSIEDDNGDGLGNSNILVTFKTAGAAPTAAKIIDTDPNNNDINIPLNQPSVSVKFDQQVIASTAADANYADSVINPANFYISPAVAGTLSYDAGQSIAKITFSSALAQNTTYTVTVKNVKDANGNYVASQPYSFSFKTVAGDTTKPTCSIVTPANGATLVSIATDIVIKFSEEMNPATINSPATTITVNGGVTGTVTYDSSGTMQATFVPSAPLAYSTTYTVTVSTAAKDLSGNAMQAAYTASFTTAQNTPPAGMGNFCQVPPFAANTAVKPNVLLMVDNSGSMNEFAYKNKGYGDSNYDTSYDSGKTYYGYFDSTKMFQYDTTSGGFFKINSAAAIDKTSFWSGNFLNWLTMRRTDLVRKVLVGGKISPRSASTANYVLAHDNPDRDYYKRYVNNYYVIDNGKIYSCGNNSECSSSNAANTYNVKVYVGDNPPEEGLIIKMVDRINFGIMFFNTGTKFEDNQNNSKDGGYVSVDIGSSGTNLVTQVENTNPTTWTPLAETYYEATRYFQATTSMFNGGTYNGKDPITFACQKNFVLILTDGESTKDQNLPGGNWGTPVSDDNPSPYTFNVKTYMDKIAANEGYASQWATSPNTSDGSYYLEAVAYWAHITDLRTSTMGKSDIADKQNLTIYAVFAFDDSNLGRDLLQKTCKYGGFDDSNGNDKPDLKSEWDKNNDNIPDTYYEAQDGSKLPGVLEGALLDILTRVSSGTAASILNNSEGSGANLLQAVFYPKKAFVEGSDVSWIGEMQNLWYYVDPALQKTSIREDSDQNFILKVKTTPSASPPEGDKVVQFYFDTSDNQTKVNRYEDADGDGSADSSTPIDTISPDYVNSIWRAGRMLWARDLTRADGKQGPRTIYTHSGLGYDSATSKLATLSSLLTTDTDVQSLLQAANQTVAQDIVKYVSGEDLAGARSRTVTIKTCSNNRVKNCSLDSECSPGTCVNSSSVWRLGDIVSSTPKLVSSIRMNNYSLAAPTGYADNSYAAFAASTTYKQRGMVFVGANDGMLHAFKLGILKEINGTTEKAKLVDTSDNTATADNELGKEMWGYVPRNALPYLAYLKEQDYCHLYYVDKTASLLDASIGTDGTDTDYWKKTKAANGSTWRTVLLGGMGLGGACRDSSGACAGEGCVKTPSSGNGLSSYFALDVTDPESPKYMWEFPSAEIAADANTTSHAAARGALGFSTTGPAIVRVSTKSPDTCSPADGLAADPKVYCSPNHDKNGRWFAVFASGPTGPIDTATKEFKGQSDQNLKLFVVDLRTGTLLHTIDTGIAKAFAGSLSTSFVDTDRYSSSLSGFYSDDVIYIGYVQKDTSVTPNTWTKGGVLRLSTKEDPDPTKWQLSTLINGIGPVTSSVTKLQDRNNYSLWVYFGTGRYFFKQDDPSAVQQKLYGIKDPCYSTNNRQAHTPKTNASGASNRFDPTCTDTVTESLVDQTGDASTAPASTLAATAAGWKIQLEASGVDSYSERVITDPIATPSGAVFFTTFKPSSNVCKFGGESLVWAVKYNTGGVPPSAAMQGKALLQVSTGAFAELTLREAFKQKGALVGHQGYEGRRLNEKISGVPPASQGLALITNPQPMKKLLHIMEK